MEPPEDETQTEAEQLGQALLFSGELERVQQEDEAKGIYTLERARVRRPGMIEGVIALSAQGEGQLSIARKLNCHHRTVSLIQRQPDYAQSIDIARSKLSARMRSAASKLVELIDDDPQSVPANVRALAAIQLGQHAELLDGRPTSRSEDVHRVDLVSDWERTLSQLPSEKRLEDVREIGSDGGEKVALEANSLHAECVLAAVRAQAFGDAESPVLPSLHEVASDVATGSATDSGHDRAAEGTDSAPGSEGPAGGGSAAGEGGAVDSTDPSNRKFSDNCSSEDVAQP